MSGNEVDGFDKVEPVKAFDKRKSVKEPLLRVLLEFISIDNGVADTVGFNSPEIDLNVNCGIVASC